MGSQQDRDEFPTVGPTRPGERIWAIDALRGLALFGVLAINLDTEFRRTLFEQFLPSSGESAFDRLASLVLSYGFEFKAISLFSLLFGIGLAIQHESLRAKGLRTGWLVRRLAILLCFGLIHLFLIWDGDILTEYALAGLLVIPFLLIESSFSLLAACALLLGFAALPVLDLGNIVPPPQQMQSHIEDATSIYGNGGPIDVLRFRIAEVRLIFPLLAYVFPRTLALMLFGSWLWRSGTIARLSGNSTSLIIGGTMLAGGGIVLTALIRGDIPVPALGQAMALITEAVAPLLVAFGYGCLILCGSGSQAFRNILGWAAAVGRMAFSNYIAQSLVLSALFYGFGLGLLGSVGPAGGLAIAVTLFAAQSWVSCWWLRSHRFGPLEWTWRVLTYGRKPQWRVTPNEPKLIGPIEGGQVY